MELWFGFPIQPTFLHEVQSFPVHDNLAAAAFQNIMVEVFWLSTFVAVVQAIKQVDHSALQNICGIQKVCSSLQCKGHQRANRGSTAFQLWRTLRLLDPSPSEANQFVLHCRIGCIPVQDSCIQSFHPVILSAAIHFGNKELEGIAQSICCNALVAYMKPVPAHSPCGDPWNEEQW